MKYSESNKPLVCMMTNSTCYKSGQKLPKIYGILWHSTGANNPTLKRYVQPSENDPKYKELIKLIGTNTNKNDWNHIYREAGLNAWIGKLADGSVAAVQTMPWDSKPWGVGKGSKGSCNSGFIQFEICEDALTDKNYFEKVYKEAVELTAYLCKLYNIDPKGTVNYLGVKTPTILCHQDSYKLGLGCNHGDVYIWFKKYGKTMDDVRKDVAALLAAPAPQPTPTPAPSTNIKVGDIIKLKSGAKYTSGSAIPAWVIKSTLYAREIRKNGDVVFSTQKTGAVTGTVSPIYIEGADAAKPATTPTPAPAAKTPSASTIKVGDVIKLKSGAKYTSGGAIPSWVIKSKLYAREVRKDCVVFSTQKTGAVTGTVAYTYIQL